MSSIFAKPSIVSGVHKRNNTKTYSAAREKEFFTNLSGPVSGSWEGTFCNAFTYEKEMASTQELSSYKCKRHILMHVMQSCPPKYALTRLEKLVLWWKIWRTSDFFSRITLKCKRALHSTHVQLFFVLTYWPGSRISDVFSTFSSVPVSYTHLTLPTN